MELAPILLTCRIARDGGVFVCDCVELGIATSGDTVDEVMHRTIDMIRSHFLVAKELGVLGRELAKAHAPAVPGSELRFELRFTLDEAEPISISIDSAA